MVTQYGDAASRGEGETRGGEAPWSPCIEALEKRRGNSPCPPWKKAVSTRAGDAVLISATRWGMDVNRRCGEAP